MEDADDDPLGATGNGFLFGREDDLDEAERLLFETNQDGAFSSDDEMVPTRGETLGDVFFSPAEGLDSSALGAAPVLDATQSLEDSHRSTGADVEELIEALLQESVRAIAETERLYRESEHANARLMQGLTDGRVDSELTRIERLASAYLIGVSSFCSVLTKYVAHARRLPRSLRQEEDEVVAIPRTPVLDTEAASTPPPEWIEMTPRKKPNLESLQETLTSIQYDDLGACLLEVMDSADVFGAALAESTRKTKTILGNAHSILRELAEAHSQHLLITEYETEPKHYSEDIKSIVQQLEMHLNPSQS